MLACIWRSLNHSISIENHTCLWCGGGSGDLEFAVISNEPVTCMRQLVALSVASNRIRSKIFIFELSLPVTVGRFDLRRRQGFIDRPAQPQANSLRISRSSSGSSLATGGRNKTEPIHRDSLLVAFLFSTMGICGSKDDAQDTAASSPPKVCNITRFIYFLQNPSLI